MKLEERIKVWAKAEGFETWAQDHAAVLRNLCCHLNEYSYPHIEGAVSHKHHESLEAIAMAVGAQQLVYVDLGKSERYDFTKNGNKFSIAVSGNWVDGSFATFSFGGTDDL